MRGGHPPTFVKERGPFGALFFFLVTAAYRMPVGSSKRMTRILSVAAFKVSGTEYDSHT